MRRDFPLLHGPAESRLRAGAAYRLLTASVVPRPIAWVSSRSVDGVDNLAPHSFYTVVSTDPPMVAFTSVGRKDTLDNVEATREFVVNLTPEWLFEQVNGTGTDYPSGVSEFDAEGLQREESLTVAPPRVAESPVVLECRLHEVRPTGNCWVVVGEVLHVAVAEDVLDESVPGSPHVDIHRIKPLSRLGRDEWGLLGEIREIARRPYRP
ncbi:flavin reductase (DIM6/NTAB) family NADH-FMN oxidoreductase RutF [Humibacillus xanthopallidus]|uniref:Flavin reductase (DIM6/NTAB) family NADH-FMN oxidoreductase RutF n=1 Tax=Humibacillus xanthopallidus TaxID=412689 RepID=A0A543PMS4_9MICO|nr:flavin reductase family protein [Humibacillus xanthopallidus]TQN45369.1 flavin reductase (DIM6/NTAB) family NADH-FMN oxidoreductase RutF [Humibacillus xanthopallidus]